MFGFEHKHPHHNLDVWEHTIKVLQMLNSTDLSLNLAGLLHDVGKPFIFQEGEIRHFLGHAEKSAEITFNELCKIGFEKNIIDEVVYLVRFHDELIDTKHLDNSTSMIMKRLQLQYADAKAHSPSKVKKELGF